MNYVLAYRSEPIIGFCGLPVVWDTSGPDSIDYSILTKTYYQWKKDYKDFCETADFAEEAAEAKLVKLGGMALLSNGKIKVDTILYGFIMKTRFSYREKEANQMPEGAEPLSINFSVSPAVGKIIIANAIA